MSRVSSFEIRVEDSRLLDLRARLKAARWPDEVEGADWDYGTALEPLRELVRYWKDDFDWRSKERYLNSFPHFTSEVGGQRLHFIHKRSPRPEARALLLLHGWPQSFYEFHRLIALLTESSDPADSFHVVVASLPGFTFSTPSSRRGMNVQRMADCLDQLLRTELGYSDYGLVGEDWGATVAARIAFDHPETICGLHVNMPTEAPHPDNMRDLTDEEQGWLKSMTKWRAAEGGYWAIQATKPQTLAYGLSDSPVGLAAWLMEKYRSWSDASDGRQPFVPDELLTNISLYWFTGCVNSANRIYYEARHTPWMLGRSDRIRVPTAVTQHPKELVKPPRRWIERVYDVTRLTQMPFGGHFPAQEAPELVAEDIRAFFRSL
jgi:pimeloyl-ACP methyl ester carboxylesterase